MRIRRNRVIRLALVVAVTGLIPAGCTSGMPRIRADLLGPVTMSASPSLNWYGSRTGLKTYWGDQDVAISVSACVPESCERPEQTHWTVNARNAEGKPLPFIGLVHRYRNENDTELAMLVSPAQLPPVEISSLPDCLYVVIDPGIERENGRVKSIQPSAIIREVRRHYLMPFQVTIPLIPENESSLTPKPEPVKEAPVGTPIGVQ